MALHFTIRINRKKPPRIEVKRYQESNKKQESLGFFSIDFSEPDKELIDKLTPEEKLTFDNYIQNIQFNHQFFGSSVLDPQDRQVVHLPQVFSDNIFKTWEFANRQGIDFHPHKIMLTALLHETQKLQAEKLSHKEKLNKQLHHGGQQLFQALMTLDVPLQEVADRFRLIAQQRYGKTNVRIKEALIEEYAQKPSRYSLWYCGVAIDVLLEYGKNPIEVLSAEKVFEHWARLRIPDSSFEKLKKDFFKQFKIEVKAQQTLGPLLEDVYAHLTSKLE